MCDETEAYHIFETQEIAPCLVAIPHITSLLGSQPSRLLGVHLEVRDEIVVSGHVGNDHFRVHRATLHHIPLVLLLVLLLSDRGSIPPPASLLLLHLRRTTVVAISLRVSRSVQLIIRPPAAESLCITQLTG